MSNNNDPNEFQFKLPRKLDFSDDVVSNEEDYQIDSSSKQYNISRKLEFSSAQMETEQKTQMALTEDEERVIKMFLNGEAQQKFKQLDMPMLSTPNGSLVEKASEDTPNQQDQDKQYELKKRKQNKFNVDKGNPRPLSLNFVKQSGQNPNRRNPNLGGNQENVNTVNLLNRGPDWKQSQFVQQGEVPPGQQKVLQKRNFQNSDGNIIDNRQKHLKLNQKMQYKKYIYDNINEKQIGQKKKDQFLVKKNKDAKQNQGMDSKKSQSEVPKAKEKKTRDQEVKESLALDESRLLATKPRFFTPTDSVKIIEHWQQRHYHDLNHWIRFSRSLLESEYQHIKDQNQYSCSTKLRFFPQLNYNCLSAAGVGKSQQQAQQASIQKILIQVIHNGFFMLGVRQEKYIETIINMFQPGPTLQPSSLKAEQEEQKEDRLKQQSLIRKSLEALSKNNVIEACQLTAENLLKKELQWQYIYYLWQYAINHKNLALIDVALEIAQTQRFTQEMESELIDFARDPDILDRKRKQEYSQLISAFIQKEPQDKVELFQKVQKILYQKYQIQLIPSENPFQVIDDFNLELNDPQFVERVETNKKYNFDQSQTMINPFTMNLPSINPSHSYQTADDIYQSAEKKNKNFDQIFLPAPDFPLRDYNIWQDQTNNFANRLPFVKEYNSDPWLGPKTNYPLKDYFVTNMQTYESAQENTEFVFSTCVDTKKGENGSQGDYSQEIPPEVDALKKFLQKDASSNYISIDLTLQLYQCLFYSDDLKFAMEASQRLYLKVQSDPDEFCTLRSMYYFKHQTNILFLEMLETIHGNIFNPTKFISHKNYMQNYISPSRNAKSQEYVTNIKGSIKEVGEYYETKVYQFKPSDQEELLQKMLLKRVQIDGIEYHHQICQDELVLVSSFFIPTYQKPFMRASKNTLINYFNNLSQAPSHEARPFLVSLTELGNKIEYAFLAKISEIDINYNIKLYSIAKIFDQLPPIPKSKSIESKDQNEQCSDRVWKITKICNLGLFFRHSDTLQSICTSMGMSHLLLKSITCFPCEKKEINQLSETKVEFEFDRTALEGQFNKTLNLGQFRAVVAGASNLMTLVHAPQGTGQNRLIINIVKQWMKQGGGQILICCDSNEKVSTIHNLLQKQGNIRSIEISQKQTQCLQFTGLKQKKPTLTPGSVKYNSMPRYYQFLRKMFILTQVVIVNCHASNFHVLKNCPFSKCLLIDAEKISEFSCLEALSQNCQQCVMIGDHMKVPVNTYGILSQVRGYSISLFERLIRQGLRPLILMQSYHKLNPFTEIISRIYYKSMFFVSEHNYEDILKDNQKMISEEDYYEGPQINIDNFPWPNQDKRMMFLSVQGVQEQVEDSLVNRMEVNAMIDVIDMVLKQKAVDISRLAVSSYYRTQQDMIEKDLKKMIQQNFVEYGIKEELVANMRTSQEIIKIIPCEQLNQSMDLIIISTVRCNDQNQLGYLKDPRRLLSYLSLVNKGVIIIGDMVTLDHDNTWHKFLSYAKDNNCINFYNY